MFTTKPKAYRTAKKKDMIDKPLSKKFADYIEEKGYKRVFVARKLGIAQAHLSMICSQKTNIPKKYWRAIEEFTEHYITVQELLTDELERHEKGLQREMKIKNS